MLHLHEAVTEAVHLSTVRGSRSHTVGIMYHMAPSVISMVLHMIMTIIRRDGQHRTDSILKRDTMMKTAGIMII